MLIHRQQAQKRGHLEAFGRSRGGFTSTLNARCDNQGRLLGFVLTRGTGFGLQGHRCPDGTAYHEPQLHADRSGGMTATFSTGIRMIHVLLLSFHHVKAAAPHKKQSGGVIGTAPALNGCSTGIYDCSREIGYGSEDPSVCHESYRCT